MGKDRTLAAALQLQHDCGLILSNLQVLGKFVTSLNRMSSEVMRGVHAQNVSDGSSTVRGAVSPCTMGGALHGGHGLVASTVYAGDTWTSTVVVMQHVHHVLRLFSRPSEVEKTDSWCSVFPSGEGTGCGGHCVFYVYITTPPD